MNAWCIIKGEGYRQPLRLRLCPHVPLKLVRETRDRVILFYQKEVKYTFLLVHRLAIVNYNSLP
jgi:hypothetical protein